MRLISLIIMTSMLSGCGIYQSYRNQKVLENRIKYEDAIPGHVFDFPSFTLQLPEFKKEPKWRQFGDGRFPDQRGLSAGITTDLHARQILAKFAISIKAKKVNCKVSNRKDAISCVKSMSFDYKWNKDPVALENNNGEICVSDNSKGGLMDARGLHMYQAACFVKDMKSLIIFNASEFKESTDSPPSPEYADFAFKFFSSFKSK